MVAQKVGEVWFHACIKDPYPFRDSFSLLLILLGHPSQSRYSALRHENSDHSWWMAILSEARGLSNDGCWVASRLSIAEKLMMRAREVIRAWSLVIWLSKHDPLSVLRSLACKWGLQPFIMEKLLSEIRIWSYYHGHRDGRALYSTKVICM